MPVHNPSFRRKKLTPPSVNDAAILPYQVSSALFEKVRQNKRFHDWLFEYSEDSKVVNRRKLDSLIETAIKQYQFRLGDVLPTLSEQIQFLQVVVASLFPDVPITVEQQQAMFDDAPNHLRVAVSRAAEREALEAYQDSNYSQEGREEYNDVSEEINNLNAQIRAVIPDLPTNMEVQFHDVKNFWFSNNFKKFLPIARSAAKALPNLLHLRVGHTVKMHGRNKKYVISAIRMVKSIPWYALTSLSKNACKDDTCCPDWVPPWLLTFESKDWVYLPECKTVRYRGRGREYLMDSKSDKKVALLPVGEELLDYLEGAMKSQEKIPTNLARHPIARNIVWSMRPEDGSKAFRVAEDGTFSDMHDNAMRAPDVPYLYIPHPLHFSDKDRATWMQLLSDYAVIQPFQQINRPFWDVKSSYDPLFKETLENSTRRVNPAFLDGTLGRDWRVESRIHIPFMMVGDETYALGLYRERDNNLIKSVDCASDTGFGYGCVVVYSLQQPLILSEAMLTLYQVLEG
jgi:hypothetical protein